MPLCIWVTRAESYAQAHREAVANLKTPMVCERGPADLDRGELTDMFDVMEATEHPADHAHWLRYPDSGEPWCSVFTTPFDGPLRHVELSASYSNPHFMRNMLDMFDLALRLARRLDAKVYEETAGRLITPDDVDTFLAHEGELVTGQYRFWKSGQQQLWTQMYAPLEFPLGAIDQVSEYLAFAIRTEAPASDLVADLPAHLHAHVYEHGAVVEDRASKAPVVRIARLEGGAIVRPYWSHLPFAQLARETFRAVDRIEARTGGVVAFEGKPADAAVRAELERHAQGLGVEYFEWLQAR